MDKLIIKGGVILKGEIKISGAKNRTYTISARAYDAAGNTSNSSVTVTAR